MVAVIISLLLVVLAIYALMALVGDFSDKSPKPKATSALNFLQSVAEHHQFKLTEIGRNEDWITCVFDYQGGRFVCLAGVNDNELLLEYRSFMGVPFTAENYEKIRTLCHQCTQDYRYAKLIYAYDDKNNELMVHVYIESDGPSEDAFMQYLMLCFRVARQFERLFTSAPELTEEKQMDMQREEQMLIAAEMAHEQQTLPIKHPHKANEKIMTIEDYIEYLFGKENVPDMLSLTIQNANGTQEITQRDQIANYELDNAIITGKGAEATFIGSSPAVLVVDAVANHYVFTIHPIESRSNILSMRMTAVKTPHEFLQDYVPDATYVPEAISLRLCYVKTELPDADMEDDQDMPHISMAAQVKHGRKLFLQQYYLQAVAVLTPIFLKLKTRYFDLSEKEKDIYYQLCFYIGFCYSNLRIYDKALFYLDKAVACKRFDYTKEYINCLVNSNDPCIFMILNDEANAIAKEMAEIERDDDRGTEQMMAQRERLIDNFAFIQRRRGFAQISFGFLDDAEGTFKSLLEHEKSRTYAEQKLKYIEQLRNQNNK